VKGGFMNIFSLFLFGSILLLYQTSYADISECIGLQGDITYTNMSCPDGYVLKSKISAKERPVTMSNAAPQKENIRSWKTELDTFCEKASNAGSLSANDIKNEIDNSEPLRITLETLQTDPTYKMANLRLFKSCKDLFILRQNAIKQRQGHDQMMNDLQNKLDNLRR
jgi:hypothetical protein